jgi:hypothetical protein
LNEFKKPADIINSENASQQQPQQQQQMSKSTTDLPSNSKKDSKSKSNNLSDQSFFDVLTRLQTNRLDDQRCSIKLDKSKSKTLKLNNNNNNENNSKNKASKNDDEFFNLIMQTQSSRLEDQRSKLVNFKKENKQIISGTGPAITVPPDDDFFSMIQKVQSRRLDEQRTAIQPSKTLNKKQILSSVVKSVSNDLKNL